MILTPHLLLGAAIASKIEYAPLAIILAFLSHYLLDLIPHIEYSIDNIEKRHWQKSSPDILRVFLDFSFGILLILIFSNPPAGGQPIIFICAFFAILPDGLDLLNYSFPNKILKTHSNIHQKKIHFLKHKKTRALNSLSALISIPFRITSQLLIILFSIFLLKY